MLKLIKKIKNFFNPLYQVVYTTKEGKTVTVKADRCGSTEGGSIDTKCQMSRLKTIIS